jgi:hypothetical protein
MTKMSHETKPVAIILRDTSTEDPNLGGDTGSIRPLGPQRAKALFKEYIDLDRALQQLERQPLPKSGSPRHAQRLAAKTEVLKSIEALYSSIESPQSQQAGLFLLIDKLLKKEEIRAIVSEGRVLAPSFEELRRHQRTIQTVPQRILQMINRLLRDSEKISTQVRVRCPSNPEQEGFTSCMLSACETVLRFPLSHHESVQLSAREFLDAFHALRFLLADFAETALKEKAYQELPAAIDELNGDEEMVMAFRELGNRWKRFTHLLFKERAYHLIQVDVAEIHALMETTSRLTA